MNTLELQQAPYVSLVTFRKSGKAVATPVWAAFKEGAFYIFSAGDAGKVKRLRNSDRARLAKCDARGRLLGEYFEARAELIVDEADVTCALNALRDKYGWQMWLADTGAKLTRRFGKRAYVRVVLGEAEIAVGAAHDQA